MAWVNFVERWKMPVVFISMSYSPYVNLSFENYLFHNHSTTALLFLYRNDKSVIIGRNQNPWLEVNLKYLDERGICLVRRYSGGGTVFHDLGNTNYCLMTSRTRFDRKMTLKMLINALELAGKQVFMNERYDLVFGPDSLKVSGSAFKISKDRAYQHGTMLLNTDLVSLESLLKTPKMIINAKGVRSVRSIVGNLGLNHEDFCYYLCQAFENTYGLGQRVPVHYVSEEEISFVDDIQKCIQEMKKWSWIYGKTPEFTNHLAYTFDWGHVNVHIVCKHGLFSHIYLENGSNLSFLQEVCHALIGRRYVPDEIRCLLHTMRVLPDSKQMSFQFLEWLAESI
ncbi:hypothetical protein PNEG_01412 [Pneumocystis murina B123]|uniref:Putative lipoate-protein ligase A n=1 Tax=Pneumocystis murina (strain B123) TaxID=1069680 RepID=M7PI44_PNEMU|nr:hypothetical protein PNEG_01412 [Pneumocystis murina B123]EMR10134.1 hypothetical protein PNEG_01412 [Pneumocystis murina B123]